MGTPNASVLLLLLPLAAGAADAVRRISAEEWARPRSAERILELPALADAMQDHLRNPDRNFVIRYPGGEDGVLWAEELRSWLVALGVASSHIELVPGGTDADALEITLRAPLTR